MTGWDRIVQPQRRGGEPGLGDGALIKIAWLLTSPPFCPCLSEVRTSRGHLFYFIFSPEASITLILGAQTSVSADLPPPAPPPGGPLPRNFQGLRPNHPVLEVKKAFCPTPSLPFQKVVNPAGQGPGLLFNCHP